MASDKIVVDCGTGQAQRVPLTQAEIADQSQRQQDATQAAQADVAAQQTRSQDIAALKAKAASDPAFAALLRVLARQMRDVG